MTTPYERIDELESKVRQLRADVLQLQGQNIQLALALTQNATALQSLLSSLGESAESLPGENAAPLGSERKRHGPVKAN